MGALDPSAHTNSEQSVQHRDVVANSFSSEVERRISKLDPSPSRRTHSGAGSPARRCHRLHPTGKPLDNAFAESCKGKLWNECLKENWFQSHSEAQEPIEAWRENYNDVLPHRSLSDRTPSAHGRQLESPAD
jgi:transposase InsO family protein